MNNRLRVLLVDSDPNDRALAALVLRRELCRVRVEEAGDALVLADRLPRGGYAAVVTEYRLAWGDGLQVLESVKSLDPDCPVVLFASAGSEAVAAEGLRRGLAAYLVKGSAGYLELPATVRRVVARSAELRASREASASYHRLTEELALGTFTAGIDGRLSRASPAMARILGLREARCWSSGRTWPTSSRTRRCRLRCWRAWRGGGRSATWRRGCGVRAATWPG